MIETVVTTTAYEIIIFRSSAASVIAAPSTASLVASMTLMRRGRRIGNERTGYSVPFEFAFEIIAAMNVDAEASPKLPSSIVIRKINGACTLKLGIVSK